MAKKVWIIIAVLVLVAGITFAAFAFFVRGQVETLTVSTLKSQAGSLQGQQLWVKGRVASGSIGADPATRLVTFGLTDDRETLSIVYQGVLPDAFRPGAELEIQGSYRADGTFEARSLERPFNICAVCHG